MLLNCITKSNEKWVSISSNVELTAKRDQVTYSDGDIVKNSDQDQELNDKF